MMSTQSDFSANFSANREWLIQHAPGLWNWLEGVDAQTIRFALNQDSCDGEVMLYVENECWHEEVRAELNASLLQQMRQIDGIASPQIANPVQAVPTPGNLLADSIDSHHSVILSVLPNLMQPEANPQLSANICYRAVAILGSLAMVPLAQHLTDNQRLSWQGFVLVEDDPRQMVAALHLFSLHELVAVLKERGFGLSLICETDSGQLRDRFYTLVTREQPLLIHGLQVIRSMQRSPGLMELHSWLHAPEGLQQLVLGMLGFATDEINQSMQAIWSARSNRPSHLLKPQTIPQKHPVVLVASGPSLDQQLNWLSRYQHQLTIIAAGSALGSLLKSKIMPSAVVYLERATDVYHQLCDLAAEAIDFSEIILIGSSTLDPRVAAMFKENIIYHRPNAAATELFPCESFAKLPQAGPHVVNAALEALLVLGCRRFLLIGCDFGAQSREHVRATSALGVSPRNMSMAVQGNRGQTVFSEPELLTSHHMFERMLTLIEDLDVQRLGHGVFLTGSQNVDASDDLARSFSGDVNAFRRALLSNLPEALVPDFEHFALAIQAADHNLDQCQRLLEDADGWSYQLGLALGALVTRDRSELDPAQRFAHALLAQPLFFLLGPLYSCQTSAWPVARERATGSLQLLKGLVAAYGSLIGQFLKIPNLPSWDPDWVRTRCRRLDSSPSS